MDARKIIEDLEKEVKSEKEATAIKESIIATLKKKYGLFDENKDDVQTKNPAPRQSTLLDSDHIDVNALEVDHVKKVTLTDEVRDVIKKFGKQEFAIQHIDKVLKEQRDMSTDDNSLRPKISIVLSKLKESGEIILAHKGAGNAPNKYTAVSNDSSDLI